VVGVANDVGLLSEEYHVPSRALIGNMPQALVVGQFEISPSYGCGTIPNRAL
jgi:hypothetical protein